MTAEQAISLLSLKPKDLPVFVLLATDPIASYAIIEWLRIASNHHLPIPPQKLDCAAEVLTEFLKWPEKKLPG